MSPTEQDSERETISDRIEALRRDLVVHVKPCRELSLVLTKLEEAMLWWERGLATGAVMPKEVE